jgi:hypothetical protein
MLGRHLPAFPLNVRMLPIGGPDQVVREARTSIQGQGRVEGVVLLLEVQRGLTTEHWMAAPGAEQISLVREEMAVRLQL